MQSEKPDNNKNIDVINSIEFDFTEVIKDLFFQIKQNNNDIEEIKKKLNNLNCCTNLKK